MLVLQQKQGRQLLHSVHSSYILHCNRNVFLCKHRKYIFNRIIENMFSQQFWWRYGYSVIRNSAIWYIVATQIFTNLHGVVSQMTRIFILVSFYNRLSAIPIGLIFQADRLAAGLMQMGLSPGDRLGIWGPNSSEWFISRLAAARAGLVAVSNCRLSR